MKIKQKIGRVTMRSGFQGIIRNHYFISWGLDLTPVHVLRFATFS